MTRANDLLAEIEQRYRDDPNMYWVTEVRWLLGEAKRLVTREAELERMLRQLQTRLTESEAENDQWQKKLAEVWAENARLLVELTHRVGWEERCLRAEAENTRLRAGSA